MCFITWIICFDAISSMMSPLFTTIRGLFSKIHAKTVKASDKKNLMPYNKCWIILFNKG